MSNPYPADSAAEAVRKFAAEAARRGISAPHRVLVRLDGPGGMASLCAAEAAITAVWPPETAKELVWLTRAPGVVRDLLRLSAFEADGVLSCEATFEVIGRLETA